MLMARPVRFQKKVLAMRPSHDRSLFLRMTLIDICCGPPARGASILRCEFL